MIREREASSTPLLTNFRRSIESRYQVGSDITLTHISRTTQIAYFKQSLIFTHLRVVSKLGLASSTQARRTHQNIVRFHICMHHISLLEQAESEEDLMRISAQSLDINADIGAEPFEYFS